MSKKWYFIFLLCFSQLSTCGLSDFLAETRDFIEFFVSEDTEKASRKLRLKQLDREIRKENNLSAPTLIQILVKDMNRSANIDNAICVAAYNRLNGIMGYLIDQRNEQEENLEELEDALLMCCYFNNQLGAYKLLSSIKELQGNIRTISGGTSLDYARKHNMKTCIQLLESKLPAMQVQDD